MKREPVFVYGTLRPGGTLEHVLRGADHLGPLLLEGAELSTEGIVPSVRLVADPGSPGPVVGDLFEVDGPTLDRLDHIEGHPSFYRRTRVPGDRFLCPAGSFCPGTGDFPGAWVYLKEPEPEAFVVPSGDWLRFAGSARSIPVQGEAGG